ncbi:unnamed protein product [Sphagnum tenellum]
MTAPNQFQASCKCLKMIIELARSLVFRKFLLALKTAVREATVRHLWTAIAVGEQITGEDPGNADHYRRSNVECGV